MQIILSVQYVLDDATVTINVIRWKKKLLQNRVSPGLPTLGFAPCEHAAARAHLWGHNSAHEGWLIQQLAGKRRTETRRRYTLLVLTLHATRCIYPCTRPAAATLLLRLRVMNRARLLHQDRWLCNAQYKRKDRPGTQCNRENSGYTWQCSCMCVRALVRVCVCEGMVYVHVRVCVCR